MDQTDPMNTVCVDFKYLQTPYYETFLQSQSLP